ncbi:survival motor neuron interacting protein 1-domain-containing protein [Lipomyces kononenkoae]|uniref:Survival motor neuron interacting protein 1-domain-containing protein n=1 Tax=Lipomyces kononenkoae TaxID=34357 RepID=A0ACC3T792_LIPKO
MSSKKRKASSSTVAGWDRYNDAIDYSDEDFDLDSDTNSNGSQTDEMGLEPLDDETEDYRYRPQSQTIRLGTYTAGPLDPVTGQRGALPISTDPDSISLNYDDDSSMPEDGLSYLRFVRREADCRPSFVSSRGVMSNQACATTALQRSPKLQPAYEHPISKEWHDYIMSQYMFSRSLLEASYEAVQVTISRSDLPDSLATWRQFIQSADHPPTMQLLSVLEQEDVFRLFKYFQRWITPSMSVAMSRWLFALLVRTADIIPGNEISILRQLSQKCLEVKKESKELTNVSRATIDTVVSIVSDFFGQKDLAIYLF